MTRRRVAAAWGALASVGIGSGCVGPSYENRPWRARVVKVEPGQVCHETDRGERDPGWRMPMCQEPAELKTHGGTLLTPGVGDCLEMHNHHPVFYAHRVVPCAP